MNAFILSVLGCICFWATLSSSFISSTQSRKQSYPYYYDVQLFAKTNTYNNGIGKVDKNKAVHSTRREVLNSLPLILTTILPANAQEMADNVRKYWEMYGGQIGQCDSLKLIMYF